jgi:serine/threonine protein kinase
MGLVKPLEQDKGVELTSRGAVIGTPAYLAPEGLVDSTQVDETADVYSVGVVLYELLSGTLPFPGSTVIEQLVQKQEGAKPLDTAPSLKRLLIRMLAADRKRRPTSMNEVIDVLGESVDEQTHRDEWTRADKVQVNLYEDDDAGAEAAGDPDGTRLGHKAREMFDVSTDQPTERFQAARRRPDPPTDRRPAAKPARVVRPPPQPARVVRPPPQPARVVKPPGQAPRKAAPATVSGLPREIPTDPTSRRATTDSPAPARREEGDFVDVDATEIDPGFGHRH